MSAGRVGVLLHYINRLLGSPTATASDGPLLDRFVRQRDEQAFAVLMHRYGPLVWSACRRVAAHEQDAEDVFQATFLLLARKADTIRRSTAVGSWRFGVAHRLSLRLKSDAARRRRHEEQAVRPAALDQTADVTWRELRSVLNEELARLPEKYRAPLLLCYFEGLTHEEAANHLGWSKRAVKDRVERGRNRLRSRLTRRGLTLSAALTGSMLASGAADAAPAALAGATLRAALPFAARQPLTAAVSDRVLALVERGMKAMFVSKVKTAALALLAVALVVCGVGLVFSHTGRRVEPEPAAPLQQTEKKLVDLQGDPLPPGATTRLGTTRYRTGGQGSSAGVGFLADSNTVVWAGDFGQSVLFFQASSGKLLREISTDKLAIYGFALSPDSKYFAVAGFRPDEEKDPTRGAIGIWDIASAKEVRTLPRMDGDMYQCAMRFTPDGKLLVSLGRNGLLRIEEIATGAEILRQQFPEDIGATLALSPDGSILAVGSGPNTRKLYLWKWQAAEEPFELKVPDRLGRFLAFSPDNKTLAESGDIGSAIRVWDVPSGKLLHKLEPPTKDETRPSSVMFTLDGKTLIASIHGNGSSSVHLWDTMTWKHRTRLATGGGHLAMSPDSRLFAMTGGGGIRVWELASGKELSANDQAHNGNINQIAVHGNLVATADHFTVRLWNATTGQQRLKLSDGASGVAFALSPDGTKMVSSSYKNTVCLWDVATGEMICKLPGHGRLGHSPLVGFTQDGKHFLSWGDDMFLRHWDVATGKAILEHAIRPKGTKPSDEDGDGLGKSRPSMLVRGGAFSPDGRLLVLDVGNQFHVFEVATGKDLFQITNEGGGVSALGISPDNRMLLASSRGKTIEIKLAGGGTRYSAEKNHLICLWELASGKLRKQIMLADGGAGPVAFSPDGKYFATAIGEPERCIRLWEATGGNEVGIIKGFRGSVQSLAFSTDSQRLVSGMDDTTALVWTLPAKR